MIDQVMDTILPVLMIGFLPFGIYILMDVDDRQQRWMDFAKKHSRSGLASPTWWNKIVMRLIGITMVVMGLLMLVFNVLGFTNFLLGR